MSVDRFASWAADVVRIALGQYAGCDQSEVDDGNRSEWVLRQPLTKAGRTFDSRRVQASDLPGLQPVHVTLGDPWASDADALVKEISAAAGTDQAMAGVVLTAAADTGSILTMFDVGERIRREVGTLVVARLGEGATELAVGALVSGRVDLVDLTTGETGSGG